MIFYGVPPAWQQLPGLLQVCMRRGRALRSYSSLALLTAGYPLRSLTQLLLMNGRKIQSEAPLSYHFFKHSYESILGCLKPFSMAKIK